MRGLVRRGLIAAAVIALAPGMASASQSTRYVFAWSYDHDGNVWISDSPMSVDYYNYNAAVQRWNTMLARQNLIGHLASTNVGTRRDVYYGSSQEAENDRLGVINQERSYGKVVIVLGW